MSSDLSGPHKFPIMESICDQLRKPQELKLEATVQELAIEVATLQAENDKLKAERGAMESAIRWACGETNFPERKEGQGQYYWRTELRERSGVKYVPPAEPPEREIAQENEHV